MPPPSLKPMRQREIKECSFDKKRDREQDTSSEVTHSSRRKVCLESENLFALELAGKKIHGTEHEIKKVLRKGDLNNLKEITLKSPNSPYLNYQLAVLLYDDGNLDEAITYFQKSSELHKEWRVFMILGSTHREKSERLFGDEKKECLEKAIGFYREAKKLARSEEEKRETNNNIIYFYSDLEESSSGVLCD